MLPDWRTAERVLHRIRSVRAGYPGTGSELPQKPGPNRQAIRDTEHAMYSVVWSLRDDEDEDS